MLPVQNISGMLIRGHLGNQRYIYNFLLVGTSTSNHKSWGYSQSGRGVKG